MSASAKERPLTDPAGQILLISDDPDRLRVLETVLGFMERPVRVGGGCRDWSVDGEAADRIEAIIIGGCSDPGDLPSLIEGLQEALPDVPVLMVRSGGTAREEEAGQRRILAWVDWPLRHDDLQHALENAELFRESRTGKSRRRPVELFRSLVGSSRRITEVRRLIEQVAPTEASVLILGESGTGKEVVARNIHYYSRRRDRPFVPVNCGAIPPDLLESELFGHEKGAFTGAISARQGRFELAEGGTLFLDEIGDMPLPMQVKLLRVLQERTFERVGSSKSVSTDVRIVAATHRNLEEMIAAGKFREDLYYRLNVFPVEMPPLRERLEDMPLLINELIARIEHEKRGSVRLTAAAVMALCQYPWPGNVRELANLIERLAILHPFGVVDVRDLPQKYCPDAGAVEEICRELPPPVPFPDMLGESRLPREGLNLKEHLAELEVSLIKQALQEADGVVAHAAKLLSMRRTTLVEKLRKYGLQRGGESSGN